MRYVLLIISFYTFQILHAQSGIEFTQGNTIVLNENTTFSVIGNFTNNITLSSGNNIELTATENFTNLGQINFGSGSIINGGASMVNNSNITLGDNSAVNSNIGQITNTGSITLGNNPVLSTNQNVLNSGNITTGNNLLSEIQGNISSTGDISFGANAQVTVGGNLSSSAQFESGTASVVEISGNMENDGVMDFGDDLVLTVGGTFVNAGSFSNGTNGQLNLIDLENQSDFTHSGQMVLAGNLTNSGTNFNTIDASLLLSGANQTMTHNGTYQFIDVTVQGGGVKSFDNKLEVSNSVDLLSGIIDLGTNDLEMVTASGSILGGDDLSYIRNGRVVQRGTGFKNFPLGLNGELTRVEFEEVQDTGNEQVYGLRVNQFQLEDAPIFIGPDLIALFNEQDMFQRYYWVLDSIQGDFGGSLVRAFSNNDLNEYLLNEIEEQRNSGALESRVSIVQADNLNGDQDSIPNDENGDLLPTDGYETLNDPLVLPDNTATEILSDFPLTKPFFTLAKAGVVPESGVFYVPNAFSPQALDPADQVIKVLAERVDESAEFLFQVFNSRGLVVYETDNFNEANTVGWDGTNSRNGNEVERGTYTYRLRLQFTNGSTVDEVGTINYIK